MKLTFLGTRANTEERNRRHRRHSALLVSSGNSRVMVDCGRDCLGELDRIALTAIVLTHARPDHAWGLTEGAPCLACATEDGWSGLEDFPIKQKRVLQARAPFELDGLLPEGTGRKSALHPLRCRDHRGRRTGARGAVAPYGGGSAKWRRASPMTVWR